EVQTCALPLPLSLSIAPQNLVLAAFFTLLQLLGRIFSLFLIDVHFVHFSPRPLARPASRHSIAQLVARRTVLEYTDILRSLVRLRLEGRVAFCRSFSACQGQWWPKNCSPDRESNPGRGGESAES